MIFSEGQKELKPVSPAIFYIWWLTPSSEQEGTRKEQKRSTSNNEPASSEVFKTDVQK
jgi:hypothetical protein